MSNTYSNILVAFDGSEGSVNALNEAETLAKKSSACLTIIYIQDYEPTDGVPHAPLYGVTAPSTTMMNQTETLPIENNLNDFDQIPNNIISIAKAKLCGSLIDVETEITTGNPANEICKIAERQEVDLIVIGQRGENGIKKRVLGSVSKRVANHANCPVLIVR